MTAQEWERVTDRLVAEYGDGNDFMEAFETYLDSHGFVYIGIDGFYCECPEPSYGHMPWCGYEQIETDWACGNSPHHA